MWSINSLTASDDIFFEIWASQIDTLVPRITVQILLSFVDSENMSGLRVRLQKVTEAFQSQGVMCVYRSIVTEWLKGKSSFGEKGKNVFVSSRDEKQIWSALSFWKQSRCISNYCYHDIVWDQIDVSSVLIVHFRSTTINGTVHICNSEHETEVVQSSIVCVSDVLAHKLPLPCGLIIDIQHRSAHILTTSFLNYW